MLLLQDIDLKGKIVLVRADLNVPIESGVIKDDTRIIRSLETFKYIINKGGILTIISHLGRPDPGKFDDNYSLLPIQNFLAKELNFTVTLLHNFDDNSRILP